MPSIPVDVSELPAKFRESFRTTCGKEAAVEAKKAQARQRKAAKFYRDHPPGRNGVLGEQHMTMDPYYASYLRLKEKVDVYTDQDFRKWLPKKHEEFRIPQTAGKASFGFSRRFSAHFDQIFRKDRFTPPNARSERAQPSKKT